MKKLFKQLENFDVYNMQTNGGNNAPNQFVVQMGELEIFQSYRSVICVVDYETDSDGWANIYFGRDWDYSRTTSKYLYDFLETAVGTRFNKREIEYLIAEGQFKTTYNKWKIHYVDCL